MARENKISIGAIVVLIAGVIMLFSAFLFIQKLSYSIGAYSGISTAINAFNITGRNASTALLNVDTQATSLLLALHLTYILAPFALLIFAVGIIWLFTKSYYKFMGLTLIISSIVFLIMIALLEFDFTFTNVAYLFQIAYAGAFLALLGGAYAVLRIEMKSAGSLAKRPVHPITINPETPYSNMRMLSSRLMKKLNGSISILDMHFEVRSLDNLMQLISGNMEQYKQIRVLTKGERLNGEFGNAYNDFKNELGNRNIIFEIRILDDERASKQHERILMDTETAYKIPPLNIINKKSEHIVSINFKEAERRFNDLWAEAKKYENIKGN